MARKKTFAAVSVFFFHVKKEKNVCIAKKAWFTRNATGVSERTQCIKRNVTKREKRTAAAKEKKYYRKRLEKIEASHSNQKRCDIYWTTSVLASDFSNFDEEKSDGIAGVDAMKKATFSEFVFIFLAFVACTQTRGWCVTCASMRSVASLALSMKRLRSEQCHERPTYFFEVFSRVHTIWCVTWSCAALQLPLVQNDNWIKTKSEQKNERKNEFAVEF